MEGTTLGVRYERVDCTYNVFQAAVWVDDVYDLHVYCLAYPIRSQDTIIVFLLDPGFSRRLFDSTLISLRAGSLMRVR